ncbi:MAG: TrkH family potassium uptake protein [Ruminococcaceae bacterium]|nr:TrkH family potassium uptake protein [Oscillospiraceae bacterium]
MNYRMIGRINALILLIESFFMIPALIISLADRDFEVSKGFLITICAIVVFAGVLLLISRKAKRGFYAREGLVCVGIGWVLISLFGSCPYWISGQIPNFADALFESVSGLTTTGASIVPAVENLARATNYWRCFTHWLGGMGVLVFLLAVAPIGEQSEGFTMHLLRAESPGPSVGKLVPRMRRTAAILYVIYILLTLLDFLFLVCGEMSSFDALCTAFATAGTGGFGVRNDSLASYSPYIQNVCTVFMLLFGVNFSCYYLILLRQVKNVLKDEEFRMYWGVVIGATALITINLFRAATYTTFWETLRHSAFQVSSIITTTGFATTNFDLWPTFSKAILLFLMAIGACAGSTGGGFKFARVLLILKALKRNISQLLHPNSVKVIHVNGRKMDEKTISNTNAFLVAYVVLLIVSFLLLCIDKISVLTGFTAVLACMNNVGPGLDAVGPTCNYAGLSIFSKIVLIIDMLAGRLEIFPILILFNRRTWKKF